MRSTRETAASSTPRPAGVESVMTIWEPAEAVGFQPFARKRQIQSGADALIEANHFWFHLQTPIRYEGESAGAVYVYKDRLSSDMLRRNPITFGEFRKGNGRLQIASRRRRDGCYVAYYPNTQETQGRLNSRLRKQDTRIFLVWKSSPWSIPHRRG